MKTKLLIVLAAVAVLFTACNKEDLDLGKNQMMYNGVKYDINGLYSSNGPMYFTMAETPSENDNVQPAIRFENEGYTENGLNKTFDLTQGPFEDGFCMCIYNNEDPSKNLYFFNNHGGWHYHFGENAESGQENTPFTSSTLEITKNDNEFTYILKDGVLKNGNTFEINIYVPKEEFYRK